MDGSGTAAPSPGRRGAWGRRCAWLARLARLARLDRIGADGWVAIGAWALVLGLAVALGGTLQFTPRTLWAPLLAAVLGMLVCALCRRPFWQGLGEWWPFLAMIALYMQLDPYTRLVHREPLDGALYALDLRWFGVAPSEWLGAHRWRHPLVTEVMALGYSSYFVLPLLSAAPAYIPTVRGPLGVHMRHREQFRAILTGTVLTLGLGFLGYMLVPARGPRFFLPAPGSGGAGDPLHGALGYYDWAIALWNRMQEVTTDAFPSLHTATATLAMGFSLRFRRLLRALPYLCLPLGSLLILSTVYLRMHYVIDVVAGAAIGLLGCVLGPLLVGAVKVRTKR